VKREKLFVIKQKSPRNLRHSKTINQIIVKRKSEKKIKRFRSQCEDYGEKAFAK